MLFPLDLTLNRAERSCKRLADTTALPIYIYRNRHSKLFGQARLIVESRVVQIMSNLAQPDLTIYLMNAVLWYDLYTPLGNTSGTANFSLANLLPLPDRQTLPSLPTYAFRNTQFGQEFSVSPRRVLPK